MILSETLVSSNRSKVEFLVPGFDGPDFIGVTSHMHKVWLYTLSQDDLFIIRKTEVWSLRTFTFAVYRSPNIDSFIYDCLLERISMAKSQD